MALRIPWDKYETALLIDACIRVDSGSIDRVQAVAELSKKLRQRAVEQGIEIDEIYRNVNGVEMQLLNMQGVLRKRGEHIGHSSKLFSDMAKMYYIDRSAFEDILVEAIGQGKVTDRVVENADDQAKNRSGLGGKLKEYLLDLNEKVNLNFTRPISLMFYNQFHLVRKWSQVFLLVCLALYEDMSQFFRELKDGGLRLFFGEKASKRLVKPMRISDDLFVEGCGNGADQIRRLKLLMRCCGIPYKSLQIRYVRYSIYAMESWSSWFEDSTAAIPVGEDPLLRYLSAHGLEYVDNRAKEGVLWIFGGPEAGALLAPFKNSRVFSLYEVQDEMNGLESISLRDGGLKTYTKNPVAEEIILDGDIRQIC